MTGSTIFRCYAIDRSSMKKSLISMASELAIFNSMT